MIIYERESNPRSILIWEWQWKPAGEMLTAYVWKKHKREIVTFYQLHFLSICVIIFFKINHMLSVSVYLINAHLFSSVMARLSLWVHVLETSETNPTLYEQKSSTTSKLYRYWLFVYF